MSPLLYCATLNQKSPLILAIETAIERAQLYQENDQQLKLYAHRFSLKHKFLLDDELSSNHEQNLIKFILNYVGYLPTLVEEFFSHCQALNWHVVRKTMEDILLNFFDGIDERARTHGYIALLDKSYFAHRLIEELHDHMICQEGMPLLKWNMTMANLMVHQIMGSRFSAHLDQTALELSQKLLSQAPSGIQKNSACQEPAWPCFCEQFNISLLF